MRVDPQSALRGVRTRLVGAVAAASITLICVLYAMLSSLSSFGSTFALTVGVCAFGAAVALLMSARHEEEVHEMAAGFDDLHLPEPDTGADTIQRRPKALPEPNPLPGVDLFDRADVRGVERKSYAEKTDGVI